MSQVPHRAIMADKFQETLEEIAWDLPGVMGISVVDLDGVRDFGVNQDLIFPQGSAIKVSILVSLYVLQAGGELDVDDDVPIRAADRVGGSGYLRHFGDGTSRLSLHDLAVLMITVSDNMATNMLIDRVGMDRATRIMDDLGFPNTRLQRKMIRPRESARGNENLSTPAEAARLMARILRCDLPIDEADCAELQAVLAIPHAGPIQDGTPGGIRVLQKTGSIAGVRTSWGVVDLPGRPYALAVMGNYGETSEISEAIEVVAAETYAYFSRLAGATDYGTRVPLDLLDRPRR
jgi:beta-lactamase class A